MKTPAQTITSGGGRVGLTAAAASAVTTSGAGDDDGVRMQAGVDGRRGAQADVAVGSHHEIGADVARRVGGTH